MLEIMLRQPSGTTIEQLVTELGITTNAVRQHLASLERDGLVVRAGTKPTRGRPELLYALSDNGREMFPRLYRQLAIGLIEEIATSSDTSLLEATMNRMGCKAGARVSSNGKSLSIEQTAVAMRDAGYAAHVSGTSENTREIVAHNCVFHKLAEQFPAVCEYDLAFLSAATGRTVEHRECMVRGGNVCRFAFGRSGRKKS